MKSANTGRRVRFMLRMPVLSALWLLMLGAAAYGQGTATIVGTVTDPTGAVVPNAKITITNLDNGFVRTSTTNGAGSYTAPELPIGNSRVQVEAPGFKTYERTNISLNVNDTVRVDVPLQVGTVGQSVTVQANALQVQADTSEVSHTVTSDDISNLATNGRNNIVQLTALVPGAASQLPDFDSPGAQFQSHAVFFNGMRQDANNWLIDGGEAYDRGGGGILLVAPSQEAIDEFKVETSNYAADLGNSSGGMTSMALKSGTTKFHGSAWEFNRNDVLDAYSFLSKQQANPLKPELRYNLFGFNLGGPVEFKASKPKTFFFYNQEWRREIIGGSIFNQVPTAANYSGNMTGLGTIYVPNTTDPAAIAKFAADGLTPGQAFPNNTIPANLIDPTAAAYIKAGYFQPPNASDGIHYFSSANTDTYYREEIVRGDHQFNEKFSVMGHLIYDSLSQQVPTVAWSSNTFPTIGSMETVPSWAAVVHATMNLRPNLLNEAAFNHNGNDITIANTGLAKQPSGFTTAPIFPSANTIDKIPGIEIKSPYNVNMDSNSWPWVNTWRSYQYKDDLSWTRGEHNFKFGAAWMWTKKVQEIFVNTAGTYQFNGQATAASTGGQGTPGVGLADFLLGDATQYNQAQLQDSVSISFNTIDIYGLDNWRVNKRLTLNLGLRWEGLPHSYDNNNRLSNFYPNLYNPADAAQFTTPTSGALNTNGPGFTTVPGIKLANVPFYLNGVGLAGRNGIPRGLVQNHYLTFAPRVGFAYDVYGSGKTILRGGFGIFYERNAGNEEYNMGANVPFSNSGTTIYPYLDTTTTSWTTGVSAGQSPTTPQGFTGIQDKYPLTAVYQFSLGIQQQLRNNVVASIGYVGNTSSHLSQQADINTVPVNDPNRIYICGGSCGSAIGGYNANYDRTYLGFGQGLNIVANEGNAHYDGLQSSIRAQAWRNVTFGLSYTWSHAWDVIDGQLFNPLDDPMNPRYTYGTAGFDRRNIAAGNFAYNLPIFQNSNGLRKTLLGGWTTSGIIQMESGQPVTVDSANDNLGFGGGTQNHADQIGSVTYPHTYKQWFSPSAFAQPAPLTWGSASKNSVKGPGRDNWNLSLYKDFHIHESVGFQFRAETFNTWNHTQFTGVNNSVLTGNSSNPYNASAGTVNATGDPRVFQLGGRIYF